jgi:hypothetical protein
MAGNDAGPAGSSFRPFIDEMDFTQLVPADEVLSFDVTTDKIGGLPPE